MNSDQLHVFDLVNHSILLERLDTYYGISGMTLECSYKWSLFQGEND